MATVTALTYEAEEDLEGLGPDTNALTLAELLATAPLRGARPDVLCGHDRLDVPVRWVHAGEGAEIGTLLRGGEVLLTTGMGIGSRPAEQRRFVDRAVENGAVGIVLELGTAHHQAPGPAVARASEHELPFIVLRLPVRFVDVTEFAHRRILGEEVDTFERVEAMHRDMMDLMLKGADTATLLQWLARRLGIALSLVRHDAHPLFHAPAGGRTVKDMLDCRARASLCGHTSPSWPVPSPAGGAPFRLTLPCEEGPLGPLESGMLMRACDLIALSLLRRRQEETLLARENGDFLNGLINGELSECEAEARAAEPHWVAVDSLLPVVVAGRTPQQVREQQESWAVIMRNFQQDLISHSIPVVAGLIGRGDTVAAVIGVPSGRRQGRVDVCERRSEIIERAANALQLHVARHLPSGGAVSLCVGESGASWVDTGSRLREVSETAPTVLSEPCAAWIDFGRLDVDLLIRRLLGNEMLERFVDRRLEALEAHDRARKSDLIRTLEALFDHNGNKADTARALYLERQSLYSRLERIEDLLGESLADEGTRLGLQLALRVRRGRMTANTA